MFLSFFYSRDRRAKRAGVLDDVPSSGARSGPELETLPGTTAGCLRVIVGLGKWKMAK